MLLRVGVSEAGSRPAAIVTVVSLLPEEGQGEGRELGWRFLPFPYHPLLD